MILLHPHKVLIKIIMKKVINQSQEESNDQGEMMMIGIKEKHHHIQECVKMFKEITPSTTYLVITKIG
jgi:hypothetical protein